ncbi:MAG: glycosyltransferase family 1 protein [Patescibacteria group bacterium]
MRIVIDGRMYKESGIGRYIRNLITNLQSLDKYNEYYILQLKADYDTLVYHNNFKKVLTDFKWYGVKEQIELPGILNNLKADIVHFPHFNVPIFYKGKFVVTIHDLIHQHFQMKRATTLDPIAYRFKQFGYKKVFINSVVNSKKILVPSEYVKQTLIREWKVDERKIAVTPEAVDDKLFTTHFTRKMKKFGIERPYIFYVGNAHPHKNIEGLIKSFLALKEKNKDLQLVLSGHNNYFWQKIKSENNFEGIIYTGEVTDEELVSLYKNAKVFVMPSYEEGFGIPILEAMVCSCPVVSSDAGSLKEVGGNAAVYFDPKDQGNMVDKIDMVLNSEKIQKALIEKGKKRVKLFSWEKFAKQTLEVYQKCVLQ